ncbi:MAG: hypothetical protein J6V53_06700 [Alphaproteobacteria bacterium]|nr:hypothetical protein [Alphaproteobacteria bacterium]
MDFEKLKKFLIWIGIRILEFFILTWFFLGMDPFETTGKTTHQLTQYKNIVSRQLHLFFDASSRLGAKANKYGLEEAQNVINGKDPYQEGYMMKIDNEIKENISK